MNNQSVISVSLGSRSNFISCRYFLLLDDQKNASFFKENSQGGFEARAIYIDKSGIIDGANFLESSDLEEAISSLHYTWEGATDVIKQGEGSSRKEVVEDFVPESWLHYAKHKHKNLNAYMLNAVKDGIDSFSKYSDGISLFSEGSPEVEDVEEMIRKQAEQCDILEGFQLFCDCDNGFGGVGERLLYTIHDHFPHRTAFSYGSHELTEKREYEKTHSFSRFIQSMISQGLCDLFVPLHVPEFSRHHLLRQFKTINEFQIAQLCAVPLAMISSVYDEKYSMRSFSQLLGSQFAFPSVAFPFNSALFSLNKPLFGHNELYPIGWGRLYVEAKDKYLPKSQLSILSDIRGPSLSDQIQQLLDMTRSSISHHFTLEKQWPSILSTSNQAPIMQNCLLYMISGPPIAPAIKYLVKQLEGSSSVVHDVAPVVEDLIQIHEELVE